MGKHANLTVERLLNSFEQVLNNVKQPEFSMSTSKALERQAQLIDALIEVMLEVGLVAATTRAVARRADVGAGLINHYFRWPELRAVAWKTLFEAVARDQFPPDMLPEQALERYFAGAFAATARPYWKLWIEATELATADAAMAAALREAQAQMQAGMAALLRAGCTSQAWQLPDPAASALRLGALYDGLAGMLISGAGLAGPKEAERHLRRAFELECGACR